MCYCLDRLLHQHRIEKDPETTSGLSKMEDRDPLVMSAMGTAWRKSVYQQMLLNLKLNSSPGHSDDNSSDSLLRKKLKNPEKVRLA